MQSLKVYKQYNIFYLCIFFKNMLFKVINVNIDFLNNYSIRMQGLKVRMQNIIHSLIHVFSHIISSM